MQITNNLTSWLEDSKESDFPIQNIPFGIASTKDTAARPFSRIGDHGIDLAAMADHGFFDNLEIDDLNVFYQDTLNDFISLGKPTTNKVRERIAELFSKDNIELNDNVEAKKAIIFSVDELIMAMPVHVGDYTDFYSSIEHATNVGMMFRDPDKALLPNWKHIPVGYHGRSSSIVISGTPIHRPYGQTKKNDEELPSYGASRLVDFELEMGFVLGKQTQLGEQIPIDNAEDHIFGLVIFNDLSARDIQKWEYVPLGPFLGKSFGSVISPWIVTMEALSQFKVKGPVQEPKVLPYLEHDGKHNLDVELEVHINTGKSMNKVCHSNMKYLYWSMAQQLTHHAVNGCNMNVGDMCASGTISGPTEDSYGSMLELAWKGTKPLKMQDGSERTFIQDNDTVIMKAYAQNDEVRIGFGDVSCKILAAK
ncbi:MAG: fumarylacetoacetase [Bacteroidetes bacterium]|nr:fumarylacetoacetase [Bacteroidota bacterium]